MIDLSQKCLSPLCCQTFELAMAIFMCVVLIAIVIILLSVFHFKKFRYFKDRGISGPRPSIFGNTKEAFFKRKHLTHELGLIYK